MKYYAGDPLRHVGGVPGMGADRYGSKLALEYRGEEYSYADLEARSNRVANALTAAGIDPGDRVALYLGNSLQFPESFFGVVKGGAVAVPLNHRMDRERHCELAANSDLNAAENMRATVTPSLAQDRSNGCLAQPSVRLFEKSTGRVLPQEQVRP